MEDPHLWTQIAITTDVKKKIRSVRILPFLRPRAAILDQMRDRKTSVNITRGRILEKQTEKTIIQNCPFLITVTSNAMARSKAKGIHKPIYHGDLSRNDPVLFYAKRIHKPISVTSNAIVEIRNSHFSQGSSSGNSTNGSLIFSTFTSGLNVMEADGLSFTKDSLLSVNNREKHE